MLMTGREYLQSIRDGRVIYVGKERIEDQVTHPAFAAGARTYAALFDLKSDPALRDVMTFEEDGERYSMYYLQPRSQEDLRRRNRAHRKIADFCTETNQPAPANHAAFMRCIHESLALFYRATLRRLERLTGKKIGRLHIVGGGALRLRTARRKGQRRPLCAAR